MSEYKIESESQKPWLSDKGFHETFYPLSWGKEHSYVIFSPGVNRFLLVDTYDPWIVYETAKVLSSKISTIVYILDQETPSFTNEDCLYYTTLHKKLEKGFGSPNITTQRQTPAISKIPKGMIVKTGWSPDYIKKDRKDALMRMQEYAKFCLRCVYAITLSVNHRIYFPEKEYLEIFCKGQYPGDLLLTNDTTTAPDGMISLIKTILYEAESIEIALSKIHDAWRKYSQADVSGTRQLFYGILGIHQPEDLEKLGKPGVMNMENNHQTMWVV